MGTFLNRFIKPARIICVILFVVYLMILANLVFFSSQYGRTGDFVRMNNFVPFKTISNFIKYRSYVSVATFSRNIIGNIVAFMPMGFFIPIIFRKERSMLKVVLFSAMASNLIEILQYFFNVGAFDVDDIILNTLGGFLGFLVFRLVFWGFNKITKRVGATNE